MNVSGLLYYIVIIVGLASLAYGSFTDVRSRTVKSFLFIPLIISGLALNYYLSVPEMFLITGLVIFFFSFLDPDTYAYEIVAFVFIIVSIFAIFYIGFYWGFQLFVISLVYMLGFKERLFGIGDIKAIIALMYASSQYSPIVAYFSAKSTDYYLFPTSIALLTDISIFAIVFLVYAVYLASRHGTVKIPGQTMAIKYDPDLVERNRSAFREAERNGTKFLVYRLPFIAPITLGYLLFLVLGFVPFAL